MTFAVPFPDAPHSAPEDDYDLPTTLEEAQEELDAIEGELALQSLRFFVEKGWPLVEPDHDFVGNWHIDALCEVLESVSRGEIKRAIINIPPGTMKSLLVSVFWPAWEWAHNPRLRYLKASYSDHLTIRDNLRLRDIIQSEWYQSLADVEFASDQNAKQLLKTTEGGWSFATSVGGAGTGEHPDRIIIDDPHTAAQARSDVERQHATMWFDRTASTRGIMRDPAIIVIMQRLDAEDLSGHLLARGGWEHVCFPMRYVPFRPPTDQDAGHVPDPRDPRRAPGELLFPKLLPEPKVRLLELDLGAYGTAGQLQQTPAPEGGGLFKREWFKFVGSAPVVARRARGWDTAGTEGSGDWTSGTKIAEAQGLFYIENRVHGQLGEAGVNSLMRDTAIADGWSCVQREEKEPGASGLAVIAARLKLLVGFDYKGVAITGDKVTRSKPFRAQVEGGNVFIVRSGDATKDEWIEPYIRQLCDFPTGAHDDDVDSSSCSFNAVLLEPSPVMQVVTLAGFGNAPRGLGDR